MTKAEDNDAAAYWQQTKEAQASHQTYRKRTTIGSARRAIVERAESSSRILDFGCGDGSLLAALRDDKDCCVFGIDIAPGAIAIAQGRGLDVIHGDVDTFDQDDRIKNIVDASYDAVIFSKSIQYIHRRDELLQRLNTKRIYIYIGNSDRIRLNSRAPKHSPLPRTVRGMLSWIEGFGYRGSIVYFDRRLIKSVNLNSMPLPRSVKSLFALNLVYEFTRV